jgi:hypothetical protein
MSFGPVIVVNMTLNCALPNLSTHLLTPQYFVLYQERLGLLKTLAEEGDRRERFIKALAKLESQLAEVERGESDLSARRVKVAAKSVRHKIGNCYSREQALSSSLAYVAAQMEDLKRYQWRATMHQHQQQFQNVQMGLLMSPAAANFSLQSPLSNNVIAKMPYLAMDSPRQNNIHGVLDYMVGYPASIVGTAFPSYTFSPFRATNQQPCVFLESPVSDGEEKGPILFESPISPISLFDMNSLSANLDGNSEVGSYDIFSEWQSDRPWNSQIDNIEDHDRYVQQMNDHHDVASEVRRRMSILGATSSGLRLEGLVQNKPDQQVS